MPMNPTAASGTQDDQYDWDNEEFGSMADYADYDDTDIEIVPAKGEKK